MALLCISLVAPTTSNAQPAEVSVRLSGGPIVNDCLNGLDGLIDWQNLHIFTISARSQNLQGSAKLGFVLYSPDGSIPGISHLSATLTPDWKSRSAYWTLTGGILEIGLADLLMPDTFWTAGFANAGGGFISPNFVDIMNLNFVTGANGTICVDSAFFPPGGDWLMTPDGPPVLSGGGGDLSVGGTSPTAFCLTSATVFGDGVCFFTPCSGAVVVRAGDTVRYQYTLLDSDTPTAYNHTATTDGAGQLSIDSEGFVEYVTDTADYGKSIFIDASFTIPGEPFLCAPADTTVCNCVTNITITNPPRNCCDKPGDANHNGSVNVADVTHLIARIFSGGPEALCVNEADVNASGKINISDITFLIARIFAGGAAPVCGSVL